MARTISIGCQNYGTIRREGYFYIDKTSFIRKYGFAFCGKQVLIGAG